MCYNNPSYELDNKYNCRIVNIRNGKSIIMGAWLE